MKCEEKILELLLLDGSANIILSVFQNEEKNGAQGKQHFHVFFVINLIIIDSYLGKRA